MNELVLPLWCLVAATFIHALATWHGWHRSNRQSEKSWAAMEKSTAAMDLSIKNHDEIRREESRMFKLSIEATTGRKIDDMTDAEVLSIVREKASPEISS